MYLTREQLEAISLRVLRAYERLPSIAGQPMQCIDAISLACDVCGLYVEHFHLSQTKYILGMTSYGEIGVGIYDEDYSPLFYFLDGKTILIESDLAADEALYGRYRFTIMHEVAHQILKMLFPREYADSIAQRTIHYSLARRESGPSSDPEEKRVDILASMLLLPEALVRQTADAYGVKNGIPILNRIYRPAEYRIFTAMAQQLGVSKSALAIRMKQLGLLQKDYLTCPKDMISIWKEENEL